MQPEEVAQQIEAAVQAGLSGGLAVCQMACLLLDATAALMEQSSQAARRASPRQMQAGSKLIRCRLLSMGRLLVELDHLDRDKGAASAP